MPPSGLGPDRAAVVAGGADGLAAASRRIDDVGLAAFSLSVELALVAFYATVVQKLTDLAVAPILRGFATHHQGHADAWRNTVTTPGAANPKLGQVLAAQLTTTGDRVGLLTLAYGMENKAAATYQYVLENLLADPALRLAASILPVECEHAVVIGQLLGRGAKDLVPLDYQVHDGFLDPTTYPVSSSP
jgi:hypothetical protein